MQTWSMVDGTYAGAKIIYLSAKSDLELFLNVKED